MQILHLDLKAVVGNYVELRYFTNNYNQYENRTLLLGEITDLIELAERDYYVSSFAEDYAVTGLRLYNWLDGTDRWLQKLINQYQRQGIILAISTAEKLAHLPWEVLHDGKTFLVQQSIIPVRWVSSDSVKTLSVENNPENRALQVLFMATSPQGVEPILDYEAEEARILEATERQPLALTVEESGCLSELGYLVDDYGKDYFDIFHITGHATISDGQPQFITETETGEADYASAEDIKEALQFRLPKLIFLSGCRTGQAGSKDANYGSVPSMAEELLNAGAKAVLGWGQAVSAVEATEAAATLYGELAAGKQITEAVAITYKTLIKNKARDWHLLRLYAADSLPGELVTPLRTPRRKPAPPLSVSTEFLDPAGKVKVPTRESFVGRRRQLQSCLRTLTQSTEEIGVLIYGMGGLGKSSLAARLCDRLPIFKPVVLMGRIDEPSLVDLLVKDLDDDEQRKRLQNPDEELRFRLKRIFQQLWDAGEKPFLLVLDDFEENLEPRQDSFVLKTSAVEVLTALVWAIRETSTKHRLILTCRYDFEFSQLQYFYKQPLEGMRGADLRKKCSRLEAFKTSSQVDEALKSQARRLADGNPRLLEWLDKILQNSTVDQIAILNRLEVDAVELREQVLAEALLQQMDATMGEMLSQGLVFELPVPREALTAVCENIPYLENYINRAVALGLLEVSPDESLRVPRILPLTLSTHVKTLHQQAAEVLYRLWLEEAETSTEEECLEIHRLGLLGEQGEIASTVGMVLTQKWMNTSRFRETLNLCNSTLNIVRDYNILLQLARSEEKLGDIQQAQQHYQQALELCPATDKTTKTTKGVIINNLANIYTRKGNTEEALTLYQQSLEIHKSIGNLPGQTSTLSNLARIYTKTGKIEEAIALHQQSLEIHKKIEDEIADYPQSSLFLDQLAGAKASTLHQLAGIYVDKGNIEEALALYQQSLEINESIGKLEGQATNLHQLAGIYVDTGKIEEALALYHQSLEIYESIGYLEGQASTLHQLGVIYKNTGKIKEAITLYKQSLKINTSISNVQGQATTLNQLAGIYVDTGKIEEALALYQQFLKLTESIGDVKTKASTLHELGYIYANTGNMEEAITFYQESLKLSESIGDVKTKAATLNNLAIIYTNTGNIEEAIALYQHSLKLTESIGDVKTKAATLNNLASIYTNTSNIEEAIALYQQSLKLTESIGDVKTKAATLKKLAINYTKTGKIEEAITCYQQLLEINESIGDVQGKAATLHKLGYIYADTDKIEEAIACYQQSLKINESTGDVQGKAANLQGLGRTYAKTSKIEEAITLYQQSLKINESIGNVRGKASTLNNLAIIYTKTGKIEEAIDLYQQSLQLTESIGDVQGKAATLNNLASIYADTGKVEEAIALYQQSLKLTESIGDVKTKAATLNNLARIYADTGKRDEAIALFQQFVEINESIGDVQAEPLKLTMLGLIAAQKKDFVTALEYLHQSLEILQQIKSPHAETVRGIINDVQQMAKS